MSAMVGISQQRSKLSMIKVVVRQRRHEISSFSQARTLSQPIFTINSLGVNEVPRPMTNESR